MARPSGLRSSAPSPQPNISGTAANSAASVVMRIGRKRSIAAWWMAVRGSLPSSRSASMAKSIIMIAFFFTMPISRMMPMMPITPRPWPLIISASSAPTPADGKVDRMVSGWMYDSYSTPSTM
jgi:hypothetical protein